MGIQAEVPPSDIVTTWKDATFRGRPTDPAVGIARAAGATPLHHLSSRVLFSALAAMPALGLVACSPARSAVPPDARVEILQTDKLVLHGTAAPHPESATCATSPKDSTTRFLQLNDDTTANIVLRPTGGVALLHVEQLATSRTWCVMTHDDGTGGTIPGEFPSGLYAITVEGSHSDAPTPYAVVIEKM